MDGHERRRRAREDADHRIIAAARARTPAGEPDPAFPPNGAWLRDDGMVREAGATLRSLGLAALFAFLSCVFAMFVGLLAWQIGPDILRGLGLLPPRPGKPASVGFSLFLLLVTSPVTLLGSAIVFSTLMMLVGTVKVRVERGVVEVRTGVGPLHRRRAVPIADVAGVAESIHIVRGKHGPHALKEIAIEHRRGKPVKFGANLSEQRQWWVRGMVRRMLNVPDTTPPPSHAGETPRV